MTDIRAVRIVAFSSTLVFLSTCAFGQRFSNLVANPGFEDGSQSGGVPAAWSAYSDPGASPSFGLAGRAHAGAKCASISLPEFGRAMLLSRRVPAAPGERMEASVWVRSHDFLRQPGGRVAFTAACARANGTIFHWTRFGTSDVGAHWTLLHGGFTTAPGTASVVLQLGFTDSKGTLFFDDASLVAQQPYALLLDSDTDYPLVPGALDVHVINRTGKHLPVQVSASFRNDKQTRQLQLTGAVVQPEAIDFRPPAGRGSLTVTLAGAHGAILASAKVIGWQCTGALELEPLVPTDWCVEDGAPKLDGRIWIHEPADALKGARLVVTVRDSRRARLASREWTSLNPGQLDFQFILPRAQRGSYMVYAELLGGHLRPIEARQDWHVISRKQARVTLNAAGFPVADGRPIFPLGTFNSGRYTLMKQTGFTVVHAWNRARTGPGPRAFHQSAKDFLDDAQKAGLKAVLMAPVALARRGDWDEVARTIRMFRNHPALLAWDEEEGIARGEMKPETLRKLVAIIRKEDPNHPFCLADSYDVIDKVDRTRFFPTDLMDIGMWWWYPIPANPNQTSSLLEGQDAAQGLDLNPPTFLTSGQTRKPIWVGLQAYKPTRPANSRLPTPEEYREMAYMAVIAGAKGMFYYMGGSGSAVDGIKDPKHPWGYLDHLVPELSQMIPAFMAPASAEQPDVAPAGAPISCVMKQVGRSRVIIAVNRGLKGVDAQIAVPSLTAGKVRVRFESRALRAVAGKIPDHFGPYAVHIYEIL